MLQLPAHLQRWHDWLSWFELDLALSLGELIWQFQHTISSRASVLQSGQETPVGIDGLCRRGHYDKLLLSEWALADLYPDEFIRRAAQSEHLFLAPDYRTERLSGDCLVVFDTDAHQWGAPRLAHMALWILFAARAAEQGLRFCWAIAEQPQTVSDDQSSTALRRFLKLNQYEPYQAEHQQQWQDQLTEQAWTEVWQVGSPHSVMQISTNAIEIEYTFGGQLALTFKQAQRHLQRVVDLPNTQHAARLLQGNFGVRSTAKPTQDSGDATFSLDHLPVFSPCGKHVFVMQNNHTGMIFNIDYYMSDHQRLKPYIYVQWSKRSTLVSGIFGKKYEFCGLLLDEDQQLNTWKIKDTRRFFDLEGDILSASAERQPVWIDSYYDRKKDVYYFWMNQQVIRIDQKPVVLAEQVMSMCTLETDSLLCCAQALNSRQLQVILMNLSGHQPNINTSPMWCCPEDIMAVKLHVHRRGTHQYDINVAILVNSQTDQYWMHGFIDPANQQPQFANELWSIPKDWHVYGVWQATHERLGLIAVQADRRTIAMVRVDSIDICYQAPAEIVQLRIDHQWIAMILADGRFLLWSLTEQRLYIQYS